MFVFFKIMFCFIFAETHFCQTILKAFVDYQHVKNITNKYDK